MGIFDKLRDLKFEAEMKASDIRDAVSDKWDDAKDFASDKLNIKSKGDVVQIASNVLFPAMIPVNLITNAVGKRSSAKIQNKNNELSKRVLVLEATQGHGQSLEKSVQGNLTSISAAKFRLRKQLETFAKLFESIHNRPTFDIGIDHQVISFNDIFNTKAPNSNLPKFDGFLVNIYGEDSGILDGLIRTPVMTAILKFREKALMNQIDNVVEEVNSCIENMNYIVQYLLKANITSSKLLKELRELEQIFGNQLDKLSKIISEKTDFHLFTDQEKMVLDTSIKLVAITIRLMNTHVFEAKTVSNKGFAKVRTSEVLQAVQDSEKARNSVA